MKKWLLAALVLFSSFFVSLLCYPETWVPPEPSPKVLEEVERMVEKFRKPSEADFREAEKLVPKRKTGAQVKKDQGSEDDLCGASVLYLATLSMPEGTLVNLVQEALRINHVCGGENVLIGLRGFHREGIKETLRILYRILQRVNTDLPFVLSPEEFARRGVVEVPVIIVRRGNSEKVVYGDVSIAYAALTARSGERAGKTYRVAEPDMETFLKTRAEKAALRRPVNPDFEVTAYDGIFSKATEDRTFCVDLSYRVEESIRLPDGRLLAEKGSVLLPPEGTSGLYVFINGRDEKEVRFAIQQNPVKIILVSGNPAELTGRYGMRFYAANDALVYGLGLAKTPSIAQRKGDRVCVTEKKLN